MFYAAGGRCSPPQHGQHDCAHQDKKSFPVRDCGCQSPHDNLESGGPSTRLENFMTASPCLLTVQASSRRSFALSASSTFNSKHSQLVAAARRSPAKLWQ